jgi:hypothetical protein
VLTNTVSGATTIYYTPYQGNQVPVWNGNAWTILYCPELTNVTTQTASSNAGPAIVAASSNYDLFVWSNSGTCTLTRGPLWTNNTTRSNTLTYQNGILVNNSGITNGPGANNGTFVGTVHSNGSSTIDYIFGAAALGGTACSLQVWNEYNRVLTPCAVTDNGAGYSYTSATIRQARASAGNQISFVLGQQEDAVSFAYNTEASIAASGSVTTGVGFDSTTTYGIQPFKNGSSNSITSNVTSGMWAIGIGTHTLSANESTDGTNGGTLDQVSLNSLTAQIRN